METLAQRLTDVYDFYNDSFKEKTFLSVLKSITSSVNEKIIITDSKFRLVFSNADFWKKGENVYNRLNLKKKHIGTNSEIKRSVIISKKIQTYSVGIKQISFGENSGYLFVLRENPDKKDFHSNTEEILFFLRHDLKTQMLSQITALRLIKQENNQDLLKEVLNSVEMSYLTLKHLLHNAKIDNIGFSVRRKEVLIKKFLEKTVLECKNFLDLTQNQIECFAERNSRVYIDEKFLRDALVCIFYKICEFCPKNTVINIRTDISHNLFRIFIEFPDGKIEQDDFFNEDKKSNKYYFHNNRLDYAGQIIALHNGKIKMFCKNGKSVIKIVMPK